MPSRAYIKVAAAGTPRRALDKANQAPLRHTRNPGTVAGRPLRNAGRRGGNCKWRWSLSPCAARWNA